MRYSLKQLEKIVPKILASGHVNTMYDGYPILHSVFIELRDERDQPKRPRYLKLIKAILESPTCDPDVLDKHKKPLLAYAAEENQKEVLIYLLNSGANPNRTSTTCEYTALEWGIQRSAGSEVISILMKYTKKTPRLIKNCQEMFDEALENSEIDTMNVLLDLKLAVYQKQFDLHSIPGIPDAFWVRMVSDSKKEFQILKKREKLTDRALAEQRHTEKPHPDSYYTPYSPVTCVRHSIPISTFGSSNSVGIMIHPTCYSIPYWFDGHREELTRDFSYREGLKLTNGQSKGQYWDVSFEKIQKMLESCYKKEVEDCVKIAKKDRKKGGSEFDKHGVILDRMLWDIDFRWNEGLVRYQHKHIFGILVNPKNKASCKKAFELKRILQLEVPFYEYRECLGTIHKLSAEKLIQKGNLSIPGVAGTERVSARPPLLMSRDSQGRGQRAPDSRALQRDEPSVPKSSRRLVSS